MWSTKLVFVSIHRQEQEQLRHGGGRERWRWSTKPCQAGPYSPPPSVMRIMIEIINIKVFVFKTAWSMIILHIYNLPQAALAPQQESRRSWNKKLLPPGSDFSKRLWIIINLYKCSMHGISCVGRLGLKYKIFLLPWLQLLRQTRWRRGHGWCPGWDTSRMRGTYKRTTFAGI